MKKQKPLEKSKKPKESDLSEIFGIIKKRKMSGQKFKDLAREGWD